MVNPEPVSITAGREYFQHNALGSQFKTGIPYALWLAIVENYPDELGKDWNQISKKYGLIKISDSPSELPIGFVLQNEKKSGTKFLMTNCALCHTAKINNEIIHGLGARNVRINSLNNTIMKIMNQDNFDEQKIIRSAAQIANSREIPWNWRSVIAAKLAIGGLKKRSNKHVYLDAGPGRNTPIEFAKMATNVPIIPPYGYVRFPAVWTYKYRQSFGWDGAMKGSLALAAASVEFNKGMSPNYIVKHSERWYSIYEFVKTLSPSKYPDEIKSMTAQRGKVLFNSQCASCHGTYTDDGNIIFYNERVIPLSEVNTDPNRLHSLTREFANARNKSKFGKLVPLRLSDGYIAPPLIGIWSRGPFLHNGSVPTIEDLLRTADERPVIFYVGSDTGYDLNRLGVLYEDVLMFNGARKGKQTSEEQYEFDTRRSGNSNSGHEYGTTLSIQDRMDLIEYLKKL